MEHLLIFRVSFSLCKRFILHYLSNLSNLSYKLPKHWQVKRLCGMRWRGLWKVSEADSKPKLMARGDKCQFSHRLMHGTRGETDDSVKSSDVQRDILDARRFHSIWFRSIMSRGGTSPRSRLLAWMPEWVHGRTTVIWVDGYSDVRNCGGKIYIR